MPGFYQRRIFPWLNDWLLDDPELLRLRSEALADARGRVVEIGFGSGANLPHYPAAVESVVGIEPNAGMRDRAAKKLHDAHIPIEIIDGAAESIPLPERSFDTALSTLTLCSVADPETALAELRRVLRDDGRLIVLEHGLSGDAGVARWQRRLNPIQRRVACGCNLNRQIAALIERAGFTFQSQRSFYVPKVPRIHGWTTLGTAAKSAVS